MISDFEARLATVMGAQLPAPYTGTVAVSTEADNSHGSEPRIYLGVYKTEHKPKGFGGNRTVEVPGVTNRVRVMPLKVWLNINVLNANNAGRLQHLQGIEQIQYLLDHESYQTGSALADSGDQGFVIERMNIVESFITVTNAPVDDRPSGIVVEAEGIFWPVGVTGETGVAIDEIRVRGLALELSMNPPSPFLTAGGPSIDLSLQMSNQSALRLGGDGSTLPFDQLAVNLIQPDGSAGAGSLSGGTAGGGDVRLIDIIAGTATLTYTPPAAAGQDLLQVAFDDGETGLGQVIQQFALVSS